MFIIFLLKRNWTLNSAREKREKEGLEGNSAWGETPSSEAAEGGPGAAGVCRTPSHSQNQGELCCVCEAGGKMSTPQDRPVL